MNPFLEPSEEAQPGRPGVLSQGRQNQARTHCCCWKHLRGPPVGFAQFAVLETAALGKSAQKSHKGALPLFLHPESSGPVTTPPNPPSLSPRLHGLCCPPLTPRASSGQHWWLLSAGEALCVVWPASFSNSVPWAIPVRLGLPQAINSQARATHRVALPVLHT